MIGAMAIPGVQRIARRVPRPPPVVEITAWLVVAAIAVVLARRLRRSADVVRHLASVDVRARVAAEEHDSVVQSLAVAKWAFEAGESDRGLELLTGAIDRAERAVVDLLRSPSARSSWAGWQGRRPRAVQVPDERILRSSRRTA